MNQTPPRYEQAEESVIGSVLIDQECVDDCISVLTSDDFSKPEHAKIWRAIEALHKRSAAIDIVTVNE